MAKLPRAVAGTGAAVAGANTPMQIVRGGKPGYTHMPGRRGDPNALTNRGMAGLGRARNGVAGYGGPVYGSVLPGRGMAGGASARTALMVAKGKKQRNKNRRTRAKVMAAKAIAGVQVAPSYPSYPNRSAYAGRGRGVPGPGFPRSGYAGGTHHHHDHEHHDHDHDDHGGACCASCANGGACESGGCGGNCGTTGVCDCK